MKVQGVQQSTAQCVQNVNVSGDQQHQWQYIQKCLSLYFKQLLKDSMQL